MKPGHVRLALLAIVVATLLSRVLFLTASTNMWDSCAYVGDVRKMLTLGWPIAYTNVETGHPLYLQLCTLAVLVLHKFGSYDQLLAMKLAGVASIVASVVPFFWLARWLLPEDRPALIAMAFYAFVPLLWWWSSEIMSDGMGLAILVGAFGTLARATTSGSTWTLSTACLLMGAAPLVRFATVGHAPLFAAIVLLGAIRAKAWHRLLHLAWCPVPVVAYVLWAKSMLPHRAFLDWFERSAQNAAGTLDLLDAERWSAILELVNRGLGEVGLAAAALGWLIAWRRRPGLAVFAAVWFGLLALPQLFVLVTMARYWLPVVPIAALLAAESIRVFERTRWLTYGLAGGVLISFVVEAWPDVRVLHERKHVFHAMADWMRENTPPDALVVSQASANHMAQFARRERLFVIYDFYEWGFLSNMQAHPVSRAICRIDAALKRGRRAFITDVPHQRINGILRHYYWLKKVGTIPGHTTRNRFDPGFSRMGEHMRRTHDVTVFELVSHRKVAAFFDGVRARLEGGEVILEVEHPPAAGRTFGVWCAVGSGAYLDPTEPKYFEEKRHRVTAGTLDAEGRATVKVPANADPSAPVFVGVEIAGAGKPTIYSLPRRIDGT